MELKIEYLKIEQLKPYANNAKLHPTEQVEQIKNSIREFGFRQPLVIDKNNVLVIGHGRLMAAKKLGLTEVPVVRADDLSEEQIKALRLADNKTNESEWDLDFLNLELDGIFDIDMSEFGFDFDFEDQSEWFENREKFDRNREEGNEEYNDFLEKFETKKTTDDCYTPDNIYNVIADYVEHKYKKNKNDFVRPFFPNGDYRNYKYKPTDVVVDNPPFSILAEIIDFYCEKEQPFFLFSPGLSNLGYSTRSSVCAICTYAPITYENGAMVPTSFLTNLEPKEIAAITDPELYEKIDKANKENEERIHRHFPKYEYPVYVATAAKLGYLSKYGQILRIKRDESVMIRSLDAQKESGKGIYGSALLLAEKAAAEKAAAEKAAAEKAAAEVWTLSDREKEIIRSLGKRSK